MTGLGAGTTGQDEGVGLVDGFWPSPPPPSCAGLGRPSAGGGEGAAVPWGSQNKYSASRRSTKLDCFG
eukprot:gene19675-biopygen8494